MGSTFSPINTVGLHLSLLCSRFHAQLLSILSVSSSMLHAATLSLTVTTSSGRSTSGQHADNAREALSGELSTIAYGKRGIPVCCSTLMCYIHRQPGCRALLGEKHHSGHGSQRCAGNHQAVDPAPSGLACSIE